MKTEAVSSAPLNRIWSLILGINILLGIILWLEYCTDYSWDSIWTNICYPPVIGGIGVWSLLAGRKTLTKTQRRLKTICCLPSVIGGVPYIFLIVIALIPPFLLGTIFWLGEQADATLIQRAISPDGSKIAEVYFLPVGAYSGGNGRIEIHLKYKWLPFVKRDIYYLGRSYASEDTKDYLTWRDNDTIYLSEKKVAIEVGLVEWSVPDIFVVLLVAVLSFIRMIKG